MEIQSIKGLSSTHCPLVPLGKGHNSAKNIVPATETSPAGAAVQGTEPGNERRQLRLQGRTGRWWGCSALALQFPQLMCCCQSSGIAFFSAHRELWLSVETESYVHKSKRFFCFPSQFSCDDISLLQCKDHIYLYNQHLLTKIFSPKLFVCHRRFGSFTKGNPGRQKVFWSIQSCSLKKITWTYFIRRLLYDSTGALQNIYFWWKIIFLP